MDAVWQRQRGHTWLSGLLLLAVLAMVATGFWLGRGDTPQPKSAKGSGVIPVTSALVTVADVPVHLTANGTVTPLQSVDVHAQISAIIKAVHIREGQFVRQGDHLFSLDVRTEEANLGKAAAQLTKSRADLANAERNLLRQRELFGQKFIAQTALDTVQNQVDSLRAQVEADLAAVAASRVAQGFGKIVAPIAGRIGAVTVYPGSLVQPGGVALVSITQIDPINVSFTLPERELPALQKSSGSLPVSAQLGGVSYDGKLIFIDNSVDSASGTIRLKAAFANPGGRLWPGMFVTVALSPHTLSDVLTVPVQAVQTGPEKKFLYVIGEDGKVSVAPVRVLMIQDGQAVVEGKGEGVRESLRVVIEGAQNLRPGSAVTEAKGKPDRDGA